MDRSSLLIEIPADGGVQNLLPRREVNGTEDIPWLNILLKRTGRNGFAKERGTAVTPLQLASVHSFASFPGVLHDRAARRHFYRAKVDQLPPVDTFARKHVVVTKMKRPEANRIGVDKPTSFFEQQLIPEEVRKSRVGLMFGVGEDARGGKDLITVKNSSSWGNSSNVPVCIQVKDMAVLQE